MTFDFLDSNIESAFNIGLSTKPGGNKLVIRYLNTILQQFSKDLNVNSNFIKEIPFGKIFTDMEFNKYIPDENEESFINKFFYPNIFDDIINEARGKATFHTKICFTLDKSMTPLKSTTGIPYGTLNLGSKTMLYYIWADIQEIITQIKTAT